MRVWSLRIVLFLLLCAGIGLLTTAVLPPARAASDSLTPLQRAIPPQEVQTLLQNVTAGEFAYHGRYGKYGSASDLAPKFVTQERLDRCDIAVSSNGQHFVVLAKKDHRAWFITRRGEIRETNPNDATAGELLAIEVYFALHDGGYVLYTWEMSVFRHFAHWLELGVQRYAIDHHGYYPPTMKDVQVGGYLGVPLQHEEECYYPNPVTGYITNQYNAKCVEIGHWSAGDFSYLPIAAGPRGPEDASVQFTGYILIFYGPLEHGGMDITGDGKVDGVVLILSSDEHWRENWQSALSDAFARYAPRHPHWAPGTER